jgi:hypothetical protein
MDLKAFQIKENYLIELLYINGEKRIIDTNPFLNMKPWNRLKSTNLFKKATILYGTLSWPGEIDIAPETLYLDSEPISK